MSEEVQIRRDMSEIKRNNLGAWLVQNSRNGKLRYGAKAEAAKLFEVDLKTVWRTWTAAQSQKALGQPLHLKSMKKGSLKGTKKVLDEEKLKSMSVMERASIRKVALNLGVSTCVVQRLLKEEKLKAHTNAVKPHLTPQNMLTRLRWSLSMLSCISFNGMIKYQAMHNIIHVDEKWFNITNITQRYYVISGEKQRHRSIRSKQHIDKIMFISAIGRPIYDAEGTEIYDGKFGIWPFIFKVPATRNSKNRAKGTMLTKPTVAITQAVMEAAFIEWVVPSIIAKWPEGISKNIIIQQDNARAHISNDNPAFQAIAHSHGFNIQIVQQPANSPDTNVNDLGFFRSIQTLKDEKNASTVEDMIKNVQEAFVNYPTEKLNDVFLTLQSCHTEIIKARGSNDYNLQHIGKAALKRQGILPESYDIEEEIVREAYEYLESNGGEQLQNMEQLIHGMQEIVLHE